MDAYDKLRPLTKIEACECSSVNGLFLVDILTDNPLHCDFCRKEVDPERLQLTEKETELVASWFSAASTLYRLWLHSGEYEEYAKARLIDPNGQINRDGLEAARTLSVKIPTRLWFFMTPMMENLRIVRFVGTNLILTSNGALECVSSVTFRYSLKNAPF